MPVCTNCVSSGKHKGHDISDILKKIESERQCFQKELKELETKIYPRYEKLAAEAQTEKNELVKNYGKLTKAADKQGDVWHKKITAIVNQRKNERQTRGCVRKICRRNHTQTISNQTEYSRT
jgi:Skp family chaperone for outer membrane proteins